MKYLFVVFSVDGKETLVVWNVRMETCLKRKNLWDIVEATTEPPAPEDEIALNAWGKKNAMALYLLTKSSGESIYTFSKNRTAKIFWEIWEEKLSKERGSYLSFVSQNYAHSTFENKWSCLIGLLCIRHIYQTHNILKILLV